MSSYDSIMLTKSLLIFSEYMLHPTTTGYEEIYLVISLHYQICTAMRKSTTRNPNNSLYGESAKRQFLTKPRQRYAFFECFLIPLTIAITRRTADLVLHVGVSEWFPAELVGFEVDHATATDGGR